MKNIFGYVKNSLLNYTEIRKEITIKMTNYLELKYSISYIFFIGSRNAATLYKSFFCVYAFTFFKVLTCLEVIEHKVWGPAFNYFPNGYFSDCTNTIYQLYM